jgi:hypothetical protein
MSGREFLVNLDRVAKLERRFLKLLVFQVSFALFDVGYFCFFGIGAAADGEDCDEDGGQKGGVINSRSALGFHSLFLSAGACISLGLRVASRFRL